MIDWFASKIGLLIFVTASAAVLLSFFVIFAANFQLVNDAAVATDIARLIDASTDGSSVKYSVPLREYTLEVDGKLVTVNGIERSFVSAVDPVTISSVDEITITKLSGVVYVSA